MPVGVARKVGAPHQGIWMSVLYNDIYECGGLCAKYLDWDITALGGGKTGHVGHPKMEEKKPKVVED
jgi:hypothetical protein